MEKVAHSNFYKVDLVLSAWSKVLTEWRSAVQPPPPLTQPINYKSQQQRSEKRESHIKLFAPLSSIAPSGAKRLL